MVRLLLPFLCTAGSYAKCALCSNMCDASFASAAVKCGTSASACRTSSCTQRHADLQAVANHVWAYAALRYDCGATLMASVASSAADNWRAYQPQVLPLLLCCPQASFVERP